MGLPTFAPGPLQPTIKRATSPSPHTRMRYGSDEPRILPSPFPGRTSLIRLCARSEDVALLVDLDLDLDLNLNSPSTSSSRGLLSNHRVEVARARRMTATPVLSAAGDEAAEYRADPGRRLNR